MISKCFAVCKNLQCPEKDKFLVHSTVVSTYYLSPPWE